MVLIRVPKVPFRVFEKLKNEFQNSILRFCFYFNKEGKIQITDYHYSSLFVFHFNEEIEKRIT